MMNSPGEKTSRENNLQMVQIKLSQSEREILLEILENDLSDLRMEIADTDRLDFRNYLKQRKAVLITVLEQLQTGEQGSTAVNRNLTKEK